MRNIAKVRVLMVTLTTMLLMAGSQSFGDELIDPTRTPGDPEKTWGGLTVFSEPPQLDVELDGKKVGTTPLRLRQVETGLHKLKIKEIEKDVHVKEGKIVRIGLFKGTFVAFSEVEQEKPASEPLEGVRSRLRSLPQPEPEADLEGLTLWERFVNGSLKHF